MGQNPSLSRFFRSNPAEVPLSKTVSDLTTDLCLSQCFITLKCKHINLDFLCFQPPAKGAFLRGSGMDQSTGRFTAPITGIYQFSANVHIGKSQLLSDMGVLYMWESKGTVLTLQKFVHG